MKSTDRLIITLAFGIVLIIILTILHLNMYIQSTNQVFQANLKYKDRKQSEALQTPRSKSEHFKSVHRSNERPTDGLTIEKEKEIFYELTDAVERMEHDLKVALLRSNSTIRNPTLGELLGMKITKNTTNLDLFHMQITAKEMYSEESWPLVLKLLNDMATLPLRKVEEKDGGKQFKLTVTYKNGITALFKPKRYELNEQNPRNQQHWSEYERHNAEIAAFHLDRLLGFRRAIPTTGRTINLIKQMMLIGPKSLKETFFKSPEPDNNICFYGNCRLYCDRHHPICGNGDQIEGSFMAFLPDMDKTNRSTNTHPYKRRATPNSKAEWETNPNYCDAIKTDFPIKENRHLLDFIDSSILDFLTGNRDRHNYQSFGIFEDGFLIHYDNGRSFGRPFFDDMSCLAPLIQCCVIRSSTLKTILSFQHSVKPLSAALQESISIDPLFPILSEENLEAIDRRIEKILVEIRACVAKNTFKDVVIPS